MSNLYCNRAPKGWRCTRISGHLGPCAAEKIPLGERIATAVISVVFLLVVLVLVVGLYLLDKVRINL